jgi:hypothetical protein
MAACDSTEGAHQPSRLRILSLLKHVDGDSSDEASPSANADSIMDYWSRQSQCPKSPPATPATLKQPSAKHNSHEQGCCRGEGGSLTENACPKDLTPPKEAALPKDAASQEDVTPPKLPLPPRSAPIRPTKLWDSGATQAAAKVESLIRAVHPDALGWNGTANPATCLPVPKEPAMPLVPLGSAEGSQAASTSNRPQHECQVPEEATPMLWETLPATLLEGTLPTELSKDELADKPLHEQLAESPLAKMEPFIGELPKEVGEAEDGLPKGLAEDKLVHEGPKEQVELLEGLPQEETQVPQELPEQLLKQLPEEDVHEDSPMDELMTEDPSEELEEERFGEQPPQEPIEELPDEKVLLELLGEVAVPTGSQAAFEHADDKMPNTFSKDLLVAAVGGTTQPVTLAVDQIPEMAASPGGPDELPGEVSPGRPCKRRKAMCHESIADAFRARLMLTVPKPACEVHPDDSDDDAPWDDSHTEWAWIWVQHAARGRTYSVDMEAMLWAHVEKRVNSSGPTRAMIRLKYYDETTKCAQLASVSMAGPHSKEETLSLVHMAQAFHVMASMADLFASEQLCTFFDVWRDHLVPIAKQWVYGHCLQEAEYFS